MNKSDLVYLKPNVAPEPLIDKWFAWAHLISPATAAMNIKGRHLKIMDSYIKYPEVHSESIKIPEMLGGPFIDYNGQRVDEIIELRDHTIKKRKPMLELANAIVELNNMLQNEAIGFNLKTLYDKVPDILKGYVELVYDLNNKPSFRFFEALLYKSIYHDITAQSILFHLITDDTSRTFVLSTPRLPDENKLELNIPFNSSCIDKLYRMKNTPQSYSYIKNLLGINDNQEKIFKTFFTDKPTVPFIKYSGEGIRVRYFGHACILVETNEVSILVDPVISYTYEDAEITRFTYDDLPDTIDYILITHNHQDHILIETLLQLRHKTKAIIVPSSGIGDLQDPRMKLVLNSIGFNNVIELTDMDEVVSEKCVITGIPFIGEHADLDIRSKLCYNIKFHNEFNILFVADACNIVPELYNKVESIIGNIDVIFLGMECVGAPISWLYGPLMSNPIERDKDLSRRLSGCDYDQAMSLINCFNPANVFVYAMGLEPWLEFISSIKHAESSKPIVDSNKLLEDCNTTGIIAERLFGEKTIEYRCKDKRRDN